MLEMAGKECPGFSILEMNVRDGDDFINVIFMGRWLVDCFSKPCTTHAEGTRYAVALTPTNSYFVFHEPLSAPERRSYDVYDGFEGMASSHEIPQCVLESITSVLDFGPVGEEGLEAEDTPSSA